MSVARSSAIPDFVEDARAIQHYKSSLDRRIKAYVAEQESEVRRAFAAKRETITAELAASASLLAARAEEVQKALAAYRTRFPQRVVKGRAVKPSFVEWLMSFGRASRLYRAVTDANSAVIEAQTTQRRLADKDEQLETELARALNATLEKAKQTTMSPEWIAGLHSDRAMADLKARADAVTRERESFAKRLEAGQVPDEELRDRAFAERGINHIDIPLAGFMFYRVDTFGKLSYFILRDLQKRLYALPYDPRLEAIIDGVFDIYRVADKNDVKQRVHDDSKLPFTILNHFYVCNDNEEVQARAAYRDQRAWMKTPRGFRATPATDDIEREVIALLAELATTIPSPRAPQIV
jgi:hypothetical protein